MSKRIRPVVVDGDVVRVPLTRGMEAVVDLADIARVEGRNWSAARHRRTFYAITNERTLVGRTTLRMHRVVMGYGPGDPDVDHRDGDGLNNQRTNLREVTGNQNNANSRPRTGYTSSFKGVGWHKQQQCWRARIRVDGQEQHLGLFHDEVAAARAYDAAALEAFGEFALPNFPEIG